MFLRRRAGGSLDRSLSNILVCPNEKLLSASGLFRSGDEDILSLVGKSWYFRGSAGWSILQTNFSVAEFSGGGVLDI